MRILKEPRLILVLIVSLTLISAGLDQYIPEPLQTRLESGREANILLVGIDARPGEIQARSDSIILVSINRALKKTALVSIPRDTRVVYKGANRKINMVNQYEGPPGLCREVGRLLNAELHHYVAVNFKGFEAIIDAMGGVYLEVDIRLHSPATGVYLEKGYQRLSGREALTYARFRSNPDMDIGRTQRQQRLLAAISKQLMRRENLFHIPRLMLEFRKNVSTNIGIRDLYYLGSMAEEFSESEIVTQTLPGHNYVAPETGSSFWEPDRSLAPSLLPGMFEGKKYQVDQSKKNI